MKRIYLAMITILSLSILDGCGNIEPASTPFIPPNTSLTAEARVQSGQSGITITPTNNPTEQAVMNNIATTDAIEANFDATMTSRPSPTDGIPPDWPTNAPTETPLVGLLDAECVSSEPDKTIIHIENCWVDHKSSIQMTIDAGGNKSTALQGGIAIYTNPKGDGRNITTNVYWTPQQRGWLQITSVATPTLQLVSTDGTLFTFNLATRQWITMSGTPIPTNPTPTP